MTKRLGLSFVQTPARGGKTCISLRSEQAGIFYDDLHCWESNRTPAPRVWLAKLMRLLINSPAMFRCRELLRHYGKKRLGKYTSTSPRRGRSQDDVETNSHGGFSSYPKCLNWRENTCISRPSEQSSFYSDNLHR